MGQACPTCMGRSWIDDGEPCPTCSPSPEDAAHAFEVAQATAKAAPKATTAFVDGAPDHPIDPDDSGESAEAFFSADQIAQQRAADAAREAAMGVE